MNEEVLGCEVFKYLPLFLLTWTKDFFFSLLSSSSVSVPELSRSDFFSLSLNFSSSPFSFLFSAWIEIWKAWQPDIFFYNLASFEMKKREMNNSASLQLSKWMVSLENIFVQFLQQVSVRIFVTQYVLISPPVSYQRRPWWCWGPPSSERWWWTGSPPCTVKLSPLRWNVDLLNVELVMI